MKRRSTPLLRIAAASASLSCAGIEAAAPQEVEPEEHASSRVHLRGFVSGTAGDESAIEVSTPAGSRRIDLPIDGPWPREFHITDADLDGLAVEGETIGVTVYRKSGTTHFRAATSLPRRSSALTLTAHELYQPPTPKEAVPNEATVLAMEPAAPDEPGSHLDLQGVIVFDNRQPVPQRVNVSVRGEKGVLHKQFVPTTSPMRFRLQDSEASEGYAFQGDEVELWVKVRYGTKESTAIEQTLKVPVKQKGIIAVPAPIESSTPPSTPPALKSVALDLRGTIQAPAEGTVETVRVGIHHAAGSHFETLTQLPAELHLTGPALADVPVYESASTVLVTVSATTTDGTSLVASGNYPFHTTEISLQPVVPPKLEPRDLPTEPVYGNTKGSHYDDGRHPTAPQEP